MCTSPVAFDSLQRDYIVSPDGPEDAIHHSQKIVVDHDASETSPLGPDELANLKALLRQAKEWMPRLPFACGRQVQC